MRIDPRNIVWKRQLKDWAVKHGVPVPVGYRVGTPMVGAAAQRLIRDVQRRAFKGEHTTGVFDARTRRLIQPRLTTGERALKVATGELGVKEHPAGSNDGPRVREYQSVTGAYREPWCASFCTWAYKEVGVWLQGYNTAYVPSWVQTARGQRNGLRVVSYADVRPGDCVAYDWQHDGTADHIEIVETPPNAAGDFVAVGGNTTQENDKNGDQSNGGCVARRHRNTRDVACFIRVGA